MASLKHGRTAAARWLTALAVCVCLALPGAAQAKDPAFVTIGGGLFDMNGEETTAGLSVEWQGGQRLFWEFKPIVGAMVSADVSAYVYAGVAVDLFFGRRFVLTPSFAPGLYSKGGGIDLGHVVEFRSSVKLAYRFDNRARLGLDLFHLSNAGMDDLNPGANGLFLSYSIPLGPPLP